MGYKLLGMAVWKGGKLFLRRKYGPVRRPKPLLVGGAGLAAVGAFLLIKSKASRA